MLQLVDDLVPLIEQVFNRFITWSAVGPATFNPV
jgi:hypothetical protein